MAPSPRKPRVPRSGPAGGPEAPAEGREPGGGEGHRVSLGASAKVTVLRPIHDDDGEPQGVDDADGGSTATQAARADAEPAAKRARRGLGRGRKAASSSPASPRPSGDVLAFPVPRAKRIRRRAIIIAATTVALVAALMAVVVFTPVLAVRTIAVQGTRMLAPAQVTAALKPLEGRSLTLVGPDDVSRLLKPIVQVKSAQSRAVPPNTLLVTIVERIPVALVKQDKGFSVVDGDGVEVAQTADRGAFAVPVIDSGGSALPHATFLAITGVLAALPADVLSQLATAKADSVDSVQLKLANGKTVIWGNSDDRDLKAKVLEALMKATENPVKGQPPVNVYDVSVPRHPVTR
ncbi:FtsQ-type POTRA domain-containing protein [Sinomonas sp. ASV322]|uniref:cell division protein FtsQ/DivIB n=1 Tax=Sinomonas sp. ASV322 TaxID=3041920 RepID=UPI0027DD0E3B|nr:FtsQ-type POTRA domain-containing protein [Sinomonas sp. ASV322]MDQ4500808.1 FtsQ-type POTRA domain-containing protein [Sinomonas sp. ASV322]